MHTKGVYKCTACFTEYFLLLCWFNPVFVDFSCLTETWHNRRHLEYAFGNDKWR